MRESHSEANPLAVLSRDLPAPGGQLSECRGSCKELCQPQPTKQLQRHLRTKDRAEWKIREDRWGRGGELCRMAVDGISRLHLIQILLPLLRFHCGNTREASSSTSVELRFLPTVGSSPLLTASKYFFKILQKISNIVQKYSQDIRPSNLLVRVGEYHVLNTNEPDDHVDRRIKKVVTHRSFDKITYEYDIALLEMHDGPIKYQVGSLHFVFRSLSPAQHHPHMPAGQ